MFKNSHLYGLSSLAPFVVKTPREDLRILINFFFFYLLHFSSGCWQGLRGQQGGGGTHRPRPAAGELSLVYYPQLVFCTTQI